VAVEPSSTHLVSNYQTAASREFAKRGSAHRDASDKLLDANRRIDKSLPIDTNHEIHPSHATNRLSYLTPDPAFTLTEQLKFALAYQDTPARFDLISEYLPGRTRSQAIAHYYGHKYDSRFKNESRRARYDRLPAPVIDGMPMYPPRKELTIISDSDIRLRGRAEPQDTAEPDVEDSYHDNGRLKRRNRNPRVPSYTYGPSEDELLELIPIDIHIADLKQQLGIPEAKVFEKKKPSGVRRMNRVVIPPPLHLNLLSGNFRHPFHLTDNQLMHWLRSEKVLPLVKEWFDTVVYSEDLHQKLLLLLEETSHPYEDQIGDMAHLALKYKLWTPPSDLKTVAHHSEVLIKCAQFAYRIGVANREYFSNLCKPYSYSEQDSCLDGAMVLLRAFEDFVQNPVDGFFATLLNSELAGMVKPTVRGHWERIYTFEGEETTADLALSDVDDEEGVTLPTQWDAIMEYEGVDGKREDFDEAEMIKPVKMARIDSGFGEV
jgi:hypothetical protein